MMGGGGGEGNFQLACAGVFFQVKPSARIFFLDKYRFFSQ